MTDYVYISERLYADVLAFVTTMTGTCDTCSRRGLVCRECDLRVAAALEKRLREEYRQEPLPSSPAALRAIEILTQVRDSEDGLRSMDIRLSERCTKKVKFRAIRSLIRNGLIVEERADGKYPVFRIADGREFAVDCIIMTGTFEI